MNSSEFSQVNTRLRCSCLMIQLIFQDLTDPIVERAARIVCPALCIVGAQLFL